MKEIIIGSHVSFKKENQLLGSVEEALSYGSNTFMFYTGAPQNTNRSELDDIITEKAHKLMAENNIDFNNVIIHAPYIINLANPTNADFAISFLRQEIKRAEELGIYKIVIHPGSHVGIGVEAGIQNIIKVLNTVISEKTKAIICIETMSGKGSEIGKTFDEIKEIIDNVNLKDKVMVCLDTCHISDAGYDLNDFDSVLKEFNDKIGLNKLACIHVNDSKNVVNSHKDRHENFGLGNIGFDNLIKILYNPNLENIPKILETPYIGKTDDSKERVFPPYKFEIDMIRKKEFNPNLLNDIRKYYS